MSDFVKGSSTPSPRDDSVGEAVCPGGRCENRDQETMGQKTIRGLIRLPSRHLGSGSVSDYPVNRELAHEVVC